MDLNEIQSQLEALNKPKHTNKKKDSDTNWKWKPKVGEASIRVVPYKFNSKNPFVTGIFYYNFGGLKMILSPDSYGEKNPITLLIPQLRKSEDPADWRLANNLEYEAKTRYFVPIIVRGEEEKGVRFWEIGKEVFTEFVNQSKRKGVGDFTDVKNGRDFDLVTVGPDVTGTKYNKTTLSPSFDMTPLSTDAKLVEKWLDEQSDPLDNYTKFEYEKIKEAWIGRARNRLRN